MGLDNQFHENQENIGGGQYILFADAKGIDVYPRPYLQNIADDITLLPAFAWYKIEPTEGTLEFKENEIIVEGADGYDVVLQLRVPKANLNTHQQAAVTRLKRVVVLLHNNNGTVNVIGSKLTPAIMKYVEISHGTLPGDFNSYLITVTIQQKDICPFYLGEATVAGTGSIVTYQNSDNSFAGTITAPGSLPIPDVTVTVKDADGNVIETQSGNPGAVDIEVNTTVIQFSGIVDNGPPYTNSLVDPG